jgi:tetratricopeptide (TPR) repeat protein
MEGQLSEHPLAELISEIVDKRFSGALRIERERAKAVVYFKAGELLYATANLRKFRLAEYVKKRGLAPDLQGKDSSNDFALADALISRRLLTQAALDGIWAELVVDVVRVLLLWTSGGWSFDERARLTAPVRVRFDIKPLLLDAARRMDLQFAASRFRDPGEVISLVSDSPGDLSLLATEGFLLSRIEGPIGLGELVSISGLREPDARRTIYGLVLTGMVQRASPSYAFRASETQRAVEPRKTPEPKISAGEKTAATPAVAAPRDAQEELKEFLDQLGFATNHYEVLNVATSADPSEVKLAYYSLARRFHPDRFHDLARTPLHARLEAAFARITQAHEMLSDPESRSNYDLKMTATRRTGDFSSLSADLPLRSPADHGRGSTNGGGDQQLAEQRFKEGAAALQRGETNTAIACLSAAAQMAPNQPRYRAYYGRALAAHQQSRRLAEAELQAAVKLDPTNASYRVMLAELYRDLGFSRRAITELQRVLSLDTKNAEARRMLDSLEAKQ